MPPTPWLPPSAISSTEARTSTIPSRNTVANIKDADTVNIMAISVQETVGFLIGAMQKKKEKWTGYSDPFIIYKDGYVVYMNQGGLIEI